MPIVNSKKRVVDLYTIPYIANIANIPKKERGLNV